ncbi:MAG: hypothetical protein U0P30_09215 [Vicinamibacterales bacterium]
MSKLDDLLVVGAALAVLVRVAQSAQADMARRSSLRRSSMRHAVAARTPRDRFDGVGAEHSAADPAMDRERQGHDGEDQGHAEAGQRSPLRPAADVDNLAAYPPHAEVAVSGAPRPGRVHEPRPSESTALCGATPHGAARRTARRPASCRRRLPRSIRSPASCAPVGGEAATASVVAAKPGRSEGELGIVFLFGSKPAILVRTPEGEFARLHRRVHAPRVHGAYKGDTSQIWCACHNGTYDLSGNVALDLRRARSRASTVAVRGELGKEDVVVSRS